MADLLLKNVTKKFGAIVAVNDVELHLPGGQLITFLGPSGCGKTTLLRLIAGLITPDTGRIFLGQQDLTPIPTHQRNLGMVFQSLALFPHLNVMDNITYGLRISGAPRRQQQQRVEELLELVHLTGARDRPISQLSGGEQQRVAIARALARQPKLFLLDEPLSSLDAKLREAMQLDLRQLQQQLGITTIVVTHDQGEALAMSDRVVVMNQGRVRQVGSPLDIYRHPADAFVAEFVGTSNLLKGTVQSEHEVVVNGVCLPGWQLEQTVGQTILFSVRPEDVTVRLADQANSHCFLGQVRFIRDVGSSVQVHVDCNGMTVISATAPKDRPSVQQGDPVAIEFLAAACVVLQQ